ncbi:hypothetical protein DK1_000024 [Bacillus phage DK1]|uniref:Uncharacterized protein n=1 Tax=Bacillus phage DK1 TaxID=2500808 RepID=A0A3T0IIT4_9CAUD|nr:hypothetical protein H3016_gp24 [Bacillus phage DK1]AZU99728.1 hypothetical protein DK1_000024 [Bacillus phage DK1]
MIRKALQQFFCKRDIHNNEIIDKRINYNMMTIKTKCKRCGKEGIYKKLI